MARLNEVYKKEIAVKLKEELNLVNVMEVPKITKRKEVFNIDNNDFTFEQAGLVSCSDVAPRLGMGVQL